MDSPLWACDFLINKTGFYFFTHVQNIIFDLFPGLCPEAYNDLIHSLLMN
jgi:hypothetical protein